MFKKIKRGKSLKKYNEKIKRNLDRIKSKKFLVIVIGYITVGILFLLGKSITGFSINAFVEKMGWNLFRVLFVLLIFVGVIFICIEKILKMIKKIGKYSKDSLKGLIHKKVYTQNGDYVGKIEEIYLDENKVGGLKIKLDKKQKFKFKGILIKYNDVKGVGNVVIVDNHFLEHLK